MPFLHTEEYWISAKWLPEWDHAYPPGAIVEIEQAMADHLISGNSQGRPLKWDKDTGCPYLGEPIIPIALTSDEVAAKQVSIRGELLQARYVAELDSLTNEAILKKEAGLVQEANALFAQALALKKQIQEEIPLEAIHIDANGAVTVDTP